LENENTAIAKTLSQAFMNQALVSILIPCYNAERWIAQCIDSALAQTWPEKEVIVVDDGSTDGSLEIIARFGNRIRWETGPNRGGNAARNRLLQLARGEWLQYLDADDYLLPDKVARQMEFAASRPEATIVIGPMTLEYWSGHSSWRESLPIPEPHDLWVLLARWFLPGTGSGIWAKRTILDVGGWNEHQPCCQEHELYLRMLMAGKHFTLCPHDGLIYRQWSEATICKRDKSEVHRQRLEIEQRLENFLRERNQLTTVRLYAINQARFETARNIWQYDPVFATKIMATVCRMQPDFIPSGKAAPPRYQSVYRLFGFRAAEKLADMRRNLTARYARA
jgi:glycosyltransferase involved in cell wall biosynthesis